VDGQQIPETALDFLDAPRELRQPSCKLRESLRLEGAVHQETISLWAKDSGYSPAGLDYLIERSKRYYDRRRQERTMRLGDRVAILGRGIAVVEQAGDKEALVVLWNRSVL
jgi:hypothetical protein